MKMIQLQKRDFAILLTLAQVVLLDTDTIAAAGSQTIRRVKHACAAYVFSRHMV